MNIVNLWLDDERAAPDGWTHCKTVSEAISVMHTCVVVNASLDHDLGTLVTGYDFALWMAENETWPQKSPTVHSMNPVGRQNIESVIERYFPGEATR